MKEILLYNLKFSGALMPFFKNTIKDRLIDFFDLPLYKNRCSRVAGKRVIVHKKQHNFSLTTLGHQRATF